MPIYITNIKVRYQSINEILMIKKYWNLIGWEPFLAIITWEPDFFQVCSFCRMLKGHKNFRFTIIRDKTKDFIFLKSPKNLVFWPFWPFLTSFFYQKNPALSHITKYRPPNTILSFRKNKCANSEKTYGQTEGQTVYRAEGQTLFHRTLSGHVRVPNKRNHKISLRSNIAWQL